LHWLSPDWNWKEDGVVRLVRAGARAKRPAHLAVLVGQHTARGAGQPRCGRRQETRIPANLCTPFWSPWCSVDEGMPPRARPRIAPAGTMGSCLPGARRARPCRSGWGRCRKAPREPRGEHAHVRGTARSAFVAVPLTSSTGLGPAVLSRTLASCSTVREEKATDSQPRVTTGAGGRRRPSGLAC
jgi:hypothetical protein